MVQVKSSTTTPPGAGVEPRDLVSDAVGTTEGHFRVSESGDSNYQVPIYTPVGIAGVKPSVALSYNSAGGNSHTGIGWSISANSTISRCGRSKLIDGDFGSVNLNSEDKFCIDGQRLVLVSGTYGSANSEYRTAIASQTKVIARGSAGSGPQYFEVWRKDGSYNTYGYTSNSRFLANSNGSITSTVFAWAQTFSEDRFNNKINYFYTKNESEGEFSIDRIEYAPNVLVKFNYATNRSDIKNGFYLGGKTKLSLRLSSIQVFDENIEIRKYDLSYTYGRSGLSKLRTITESKDGVSLQPTTFTWADPDKGLNFDPVERNGGRFPNGTFLNLDDDLTPEWVSLKNEGSGVTSYANEFNGQIYDSSCVTTFSGLAYLDRNLESFDLNGDGRDELIFTYNNSIYALFYQSNGCLESGSSAKVKIADIDTTEKRWFFGDINGDALPDVVYQRGINTYVKYHSGQNSSSNQFYGSEQLVHFNTPSYVDSPGVKWSTLHYINVEHSSYADFNGDGRIDMLVKVTRVEGLTPGYCEARPFDQDCGPGNTGQSQTTFWAVVTSDGNNVFNEYANVGSLSVASVKNEDIKFADINADGLVDLVFKNQSDDRWHYRLFTGKSFLPSQTTHVDKDHSIYFGDHDLDGLTEIMFFVGNILHKREFTRSGFLTSGKTNISVRGESGWPFYQFDINADGELDIVSVEIDAHTTYTNYDNYTTENKTPFQVRDKITQIDNGLGVITSITYKALTDPQYPDLYEEHSGWEYDSQGNVQFNQTGPKYVVQKVLSSSPAYNNVNNTNGVEYRYGKMRSNALYGSLGFEWLETINLQTNMITRTTYRLDYPYIGRPTLTQVWYGSRTSSRLISEARSYYDVKDVGSYIKSDGSYEDILLPYLSKNTVDNFDFNVVSLSTGNRIGQTITTNTFNNYGDPTEQNVYVCYGNVPNCESSGWLKRTKSENSYLPANLSDWILGRLSRSQVTHYADGQSSVTRTSAFEYNSVTGILEAEILEPDSSDRKKKLRTQYAHDTYGNVIRTTTCDNTVNCSTVPTSDPFDVYRVHRTSESIYDSDGRYVTKEKNGYGQVTTEFIERNELGLPTKIKDIFGKETQAVFGTFGQEYYTLLSTGNWNKEIRRLCSEVTCPTTAQIRVEKTAANGSLSYEFLDALGRTVKTQVQGFDDFDVITETAYDTKGRVDHTVLPYRTGHGETQHKTYTSYDILDRVVGVDYPDGSYDELVYNGYDSAQRAVKVSTYNALRQVKSEFKDAAGRVIKSVDNGGSELTYKYNAADDLLEVRLNNVLQSSIEYDNLGRKTRMWDYDKGAQNGKSWYYEYNAANEPVYQKDAIGQQLRIYRDRSGRTIRQLDSNQSNGHVNDARWSFNNTTSVSGSIGQLLSEWDVLDSSLKTDYQYDDFGRNYIVTKTIAGKTFTNKTVFDEIGRVSKTLDSSGAQNGIKYNYNTRGYLVSEQEANSTSGRLYRTIQDMDAYGNITLEKAGNDVVTSRTYDSRTSRLTHIQTSKSGSLRQSLEYRWDKLGRMEFRQSARNNRTDNFDYDSMNRVISVNGGNQYEYYPNGNIKRKSDVGNYSYGGTCNGVKAGHHAVSTAGSTSYCYDLNGNMVSGGGRSITYSTFSKATKIVKGSHTTDFAYSPSRTRYKRVDKSGSSVTTTFYVGNGVEFIQRPNGSTFYRRSVPGGIVEVSSSGIFTEKYVHSDHLGSTDVITNSSGNIIQEFSFDAFGQKRSSSNWSTLITSTLYGPLQNTSLGFTGHEMADEVGIIHMNGRIYDAKLGRFMQADPYIDGVKDSQGYNRYSYVRNNPLAYTDPTGYRRSSGLKLFNNLMKLASFSFGIIPGLLINNSEIGQGLYVAAAALTCGPCGAMAAAHVTGINGGNLTQSLEAGAKAYITNNISEYFGGSGIFTKAAVAGGISVLQGDKFGHGFLSSMLAFPAKNPFVGALIGGLVSEATGGKFVNGAVHGAFSVMMKGGASPVENIINQFSTSGDGSTGRTVLNDTENSGEAVKILDGRVVLKKYGSKDAKVTPEEIKKVEEAFKDIVSKGGKNGKELMAHISEQIPLTIYLNDLGGNASERYSGIITVDLNSQVRFATTGKLFGATRIIAHEAAHAMMGAIDTKAQLRNGRDRFLVVPFVDGIMSGIDGSTRGNYDNACYLGDKKCSINSKNW